MAHHNPVVRLGGWALGLALLAGCAAPVRPSPTPGARLYPLPRLASPEYGVQVFLWWHALDPAGERDMALVKDLGFGWIKQQFAWRDLANVRGHYYWERTDRMVALAEQMGLKILARLDQQPLWAQADPAVFDLSGPPANYADFGEYCGAVAGRYRGRVAAYEVWNEPNLAREWNNQPPNPAEYAELLRGCYLAIKEADPDAIVISAGLAPTGPADPAVAMSDVEFFQGLYDSGAAPYFDMLGVHAPGYANPPEMSPAEAEADPYWQGRWWVFRHVEDIRALMLAYSDGDKQIAVTEMGWTSDPINPAYSWHRVSEEQKADYLVRAYQYARANWQPWIGLMSAIYIADPGWTEQDEQYWWAITRPGDPPQLLPAYEALKNMGK
jgi:hypothetical protein